MSIFEYFVPFKHTCTRHAVFSASDINHVEILLQILYWHVVQLINIEFFWNTTENTTTLNYELLQSTEWPLLMFLMLVDFGHLQNLRHRAHSFYVKWVRTQSHYLIDAPCKYIVIKKFLIWPGFEHKSAVQRLTH